MSAVISQTLISEVTRIVRPGIGPVYRAVVPLQTVYELLRDNHILYSPKYQRGFKPTTVDAKALGDFDRLLPFDDGEIQVDASRSAEIAVKYLLGNSGMLVGGEMKALYSADLTWNARREDGRPEPEYDPARRTLGIRTVITVPDSAHRHRAYYTLGLWKAHPSEVPARVAVDGTPIPRDQVLDLLADLDLEDEAAHSTFVTIYNLDARREGYLYDEFNSDAKPPAGAKAIALAPRRTPERRFISDLMELSKIFDPSEIETERNSIGSKSRKLTTIKTLVEAAKQQDKLLIRLEKDGEQNRFTDLVEFVAAFFEEWASHFPAFLPGSSAEVRHSFRSESYALSNIMFHPLMQLAFDLWREHDEAGTSWSTDESWKDAVARIAGGTQERDEENGGILVEVDVMSKDNPAWRGRIETKKVAADGSVSWAVSSTRQTRLSAYQYLRRIGGLEGDL